MFGTWFSFRQGAKLDAQDIYVPHPWRAAWLAIVLSASATPPLVDALIQDNRVSAIWYSFIMGIPWIVSRLNSALQKAHKQQGSAFSSQVTPTKAGELASSMRRIC